MSDIWQPEYEFSEAGTESIRFRRQWVINEEDVTIGENWCHEPLCCGKWLHYHPDLIVEQCHFEEGRVFLLGLGIYPDRPRDRFVDMVAMKGGSPSDRLLGSIIDLAGMYVVIHVSQEEISLYTDPSAMMGVFHRNGQASSSPCLIPPLERDLHLDAVFPFGGANDWYPGSLCPFVGIKALIANHRLDLISGREVRFWPTQEIPKLDSEVSKETITALLRGSIEAYLNRGTVLLSLTGGRDSRVNLAAARSFVDRIHFFTIRTDRVKPCDLRVPAEFARIFPLDHRFVDAKPTPDWLRSLYDEISGGLAIGARRDILDGCLQIAGPDRIHVNGNLGAVTKSFFWDCRSPKRVKIGGLAKEFVSKPKPILAGVREWLDTVPKDLPPTTVYNLMYFEQRGGRWMGVGEN
ncbi:MAG: hypothetical protein KC964_05880, partial [Candidatus Omnitrophica bacterium]|nr:hypothetical protein [Candidatus Omnitrophota bacterium]